MANIWKIGAWPGLWGIKTKQNKEKYITEYALPRNFIAFGYGWVPDFRKLNENQIRCFIIKRRRGAIARRTQEILDFARVIRKGDIVLLYSIYKVYVGIVAGRYCYVKKGSRRDFIKNTINKNRAPHRRDVIWLFNKRPFSANFSCWQDTLHIVSETDLNRVNDLFLRRFLKHNLSQ
jgi:predicted Mrr-cat superfamily restriction endonuclease